MSKPPLDLHAELVTPDGNTFRWGSEKRNAQDIPKGISFASKRYEGFERCSLNLARDTRGEYPDLGLFDGLNLIGYEGSTAYEGRIAQVPRSSPHQIDVEATGWMAHARDQKCRPFYVDRDVSKWEGPDVQRQIAIHGIPRDIGSIGVAHTPTNEQALKLSVEGAWSAGMGKVAEAYYRAPPGVNIKRVTWNWTFTTFTNVAGDANWQAIFFASDDGHTTFDGASADFATTASGSTGHNFTTPRPVVLAYLVYLSGPAGNASTDYGVYLKSLAVYGNHALTHRATIDGLAEGFYVSDMVSDIAATYCPRLSTAGVQGTTYPVPQAAWHDRIDPYDAWLELNKYHLWELGVWEDRTLNYYPSDLTDYDWQVRSTDPGVSYTLQGDSTDHLANFAVVQFQNVITGLPDEVSPDTHPELRDTSVENPANRWGIDKEFGVNLSVPTDPDGAAQIGRAALAENNQPKGAGTISFSGHIRDRAGNWQPGWKVRATDTIAIVDHPNDRPRMIVEAQWDHDSKRGTVGVDSTLNRVDAYLDRTATALKAGGL